MKVLISWSGTRSEAIALVLKDWLHGVLPCVEPWVSSDDIRKGKRWTGELAGHLEETQYGIFVVLKDNRGSPWLHFEAGAISKWVSSSNVAPLLIEMTSGELEEPLAQFQATLFDQQDMLRLIKGLNAECPNPVAPGKLEETFSSAWGTLHQEVTSILQRIPQLPVGGEAPVEGPSLELDAEHIDILTAIGGSESNFVTLSDLAGQIKMKRARLEERLEELAQADYLKESHNPLIGTSYRAATRGRRYLMDKGIL